MDKLNDDCLLRILFYTDLREQLILIKQHTRFNDLMPYAWRRQYNRKLDICMFSTDFTYHEFDYFLESLKNSVWEIRLKNATAAIFDVLLSRIYPNVNDFRYNLRPPPILNDEVIIQMARSFPNLRTFSPHGRYKGDYFAEFDKLEHLTLSYCSNKFSVENFARLIEKYQLKTLKLDIFERKHVQKYTIPLSRLLNLEYLKVISEELEWFDIHLAQMHKLKELIVTCVDQTTLHQLCNKLQNSERRNIHSLESCNTDNAVFEIFNSNLNVERLSIVTDSKLLHQSDQINFQRFSNLREIFFNVCFIGEEANLTQMLYNIPQVELLSLEECDCLFTDYFILAERIAEGRTKRLKLNLWHNVATINGKTVEVNWHQCGHSNLLEFLTSGLSNDISFEPIRIIFK